QRGIAGPKGERGSPGKTIDGWIVDRGTYCITPRFSDGRLGPPLELRELFVQAEDNIPAGGRSALSGDPVLSKLKEMNERLDLFLARLDELERIFQRYIELTRAIQTGVPPPPAPRVN